MGEGRLFVNGAALNRWILLGVSLVIACHRPAISSFSDNANGGEALGVVQTCRDDAKRCHDYAASPSASAVCDQEFRSCLAALVQDGGDSPGRRIELSTTGGAQQKCFDDVRECLVAMSAPATCANRACECLESATVTEHGARR
jgi:hypothetical protein